MPKLTSSNTTHLARCLQGKNSAYNVTLINTQIYKNKTNESSQKLLSTNLLEIKCLTYDCGEQPIANPTNPRNTNSHV